MNWVRMAAAGDKVVCISKGVWFVDLMEEYTPVIGEVYTLASVGIARSIVYVTIKEYPYWIRYDPGLFQPAMKKRRSTETGMAILRWLLKGVNARSDA